MERKKQNLTIDLFKRVCSSYEDAISKTKIENNLEHFKQYLSKSFAADKLNISWEGDYENLYKFYIYLKDKLNVNFTNVNNVSSNYFTFLKNGQNAGFDTTDNFISFNEFVNQTTSAANMDEKARKAIYSLYKLSCENKQLTQTEKEVVLDAITDKKNQLNLRKKHPFWNFLAKKGGTLLAIGISAFIGAAVATAALPAGATFGPIAVAANPINNIISFGLLGAGIGSALSFVIIKAKNFISKKFIYKYTSSKKEMKDLEEGLITVDELKQSYLEKFEKNMKRW